MRRRLAPWALVAVAAAAYPVAVLAGGAPRDRAPLPPDAVDEVRIVSGWLAEHDLHELPLEPTPSAEALAAFVRAAA